MNIYEKATGILGSPNAYGGSLSDLLTEVKRIRLKLGRQGYLLDNYLSMLLKAANTKLSFEAAEDGFTDSSDLRLLCTDLIYHIGEKKSHLQYALVQRAFEKNPDIAKYQESQTQINLLSALCFDEYLPFAAENFLFKLKKEIDEEYDLPAHRALYRNIVEVVGAPTMERLNLNLRQCFLTVPLLSLYIQGFTNDLLYCLTTRDEETSKQIFQLLLDNSTPGSDE